MPTTFSVKNFLRPAPARVQKIAALVKILGGGIVVATASEHVPPQYKAALAIAGIVVAMLAESLEKLSPPATAPDDAAAEPVVAVVVVASAPPELAGEATPPAEFAGGNL